MLTQTSSSILDSLAQHQRHLGSGSKCKFSSPPSGTQFKNLRVGAHSVFKQGLQAILVNARLWEPQL